MTALKTLAASANRNQSKGEMTAYTVRVLVVQPVFMEQLGLAKTQYKTRTIYGHSRADAMKRAGIQ